MDRASSQPHVTRHTLPPRLAYAAGVVYASQGKLYALDATDGHGIRDYDLHSYLALTVVDDVIYTGTTTKDASGEYAYSYQATSAATGAPIWNAPVHGRPYYAPLVSDTGVLVAVVEATLYSLDRRTGIWRWRYPTEGFLGAAPVVADGMVYLSPVVNKPGTAYAHALDAATGQPRWRMGLPATTSHRLAVYGDTVYATMPNDGGLLALDRRGGARQWWQPLVSQPASTPVALDDAIYVVCSHSRFDPGIWEAAPDDGPLPNPYVLSAVLVAMRADDGSLLWERPIGAGRGVAHAGEPVAGANGTIFVGADDGALYAYDATTGAPRWRYQTEGDKVSGPLPVGDNVYIGASDGYVYALDTAAGALRWRAFTSTAIYSVTSLRERSITVGGVHDAHDPA